MSGDHLVKNCPPRLSKYHTFFFSKGLTHDLGKKKKMEFSTLLVLKQNGPCCWPSSTKTSLSTLEKIWILQSRHIEIFQKGNP